MLCAGLSIGLNASEVSAEQSSWRFVPRFVKDTASATSDYIASWIPQSIKDTVNSWSTRKKMEYAAATLGALLVVYNRDQIIEWATKVLSQQNAPELSEQDKLKATILDIAKNGKWYEVEDMIERAQKLSANGQKQEGRDMLYGLLEGGYLSRRYPDRAQMVVNALGQFGDDPSWVLVRVQRAEARQ